MHSAPKREHGHHLALPQLALHSSATASTLPRHWAKLPLAVAPEFVLQHTPNMHGRWSRLAPCCYKPGPALAWAWALQEVCKARPRPLFWGTASIPMPPWPPQQAHVRATPHTT